MFYTNVISGRGVVKSMIRGGMGLIPKNFLVPGREKRAP